MKNCMCCDFIVYAVTYMQKVVYIVTKKCFTTEFGCITIMMSNYEKHFAENAGCFFCYTILFADVAEFGLLHWS